MLKDTLKNGQPIILAEVAYLAKIVLENILVGVGEFELVVNKVGYVLRHLFSQLELFVVPCEHKAKEVIMQSPE